MPALKRLWPFIFIFCSFRYVNSEESEESTTRIPNYSTPALLNFTGSTFETYENQTESLNSFYTETLTTSLPKTYIVNQTKNLTDAEDSNWQTTENIADYSYENMESVESIFGATSQDFAGSSTEFTETSVFTDSDTNTSEIGDVETILWEDSRTTTALGYSTTPRIEIFTKNKEKYSKTTENLSETTKKVLNDLEQEDRLKEAEPKAEEIAEKESPDVEQMQINESETHSILEALKADKKSGENSVGKLIEDIAEHSFTVDPKEFTTEQEKVDNSTEIASTIDDISTTTDEFKDLDKSTLKNVNEMKTDVFENVTKAVENEEGPLITETLANMNEIEASTNEASEDIALNESLTTDNVDVVTDNANFLNYELQMLTTETLKYDDNTEHVLTDSSEMNNTVYIPTTTNQYEEEVMYGQDMITTEHLKTRKEIEALIQNVVTENANIVNIPLTTDKDAAPEETMFEQETLTTETLNEIEANSKLLNSINNPTTTDRNQLSDKIEEVQKYEGEMETEEPVTLTTETMTDIQATTNQYEVSDKTTSTIEETMNEVEPTTTTEFEAAINIDEAVTNKRDNEKGADKDADKINSSFATINHPEDEISNDVTTDFSTGENSKYFETELIVETVTSLELSKRVDLEENETTKVTPSILDNETTTMYPMTVNNQWEVDEDKKVISEETTTNDLYYTATEVYGELGEKEITKSILDNKKYAETTESSNDNEGTTTMSPITVNIQLEADEDQKVISEETTTNEFYYTTTEVYIELAINNLYLDSSVSIKPDLSDDNKKAKEVHQLEFALNEKNNTLEVISEELATDNEEATTENDTIITDNFEMSANKETDEDMKAIAEESTTNELVYTTTDLYEKFHLDPPKYVYLDAPELIKTDLSDDIPEENGMTNKGDDKVTIVRANQSELELFENVKSISITEINPAASESIETDIARSKIGHSQRKSKKTEIEENDKITTEKPESTLIVSTEATVTSTTEDYENRNLYKSILDILVTEKNEFEVTYRAVTNEEKNFNENIITLYENNSELLEEDAAIDEDASINSFELDLKTVTTTENTFSTVKEYATTLETTDNPGDESELDISEEEKSVSAFEESGEDVSTISDASEEEDFENTDEIPYESEIFVIDCGYKLWANFSLNVYINKTMIKMPPNSDVIGECKPNGVFMTIKWSSPLEHVNTSISFNVISNGNQFYLDAAQVNVQRPYGHGKSDVLASKENLQLYETNQGELLDIEKYIILFDDSLALEIWKMHLLCEKPKFSESKHPTEKVIAHASDVVVEIIGACFGCMVLLTVALLYVYKKFRTNVLKVTLE